MKFGAPLRILVVAIVCVFALVGLVVREGMLRASGTEAILSMEAVDPRSLLSGHYVILNLQEAATIPHQCDAINAIDERPDQRSRSHWLALRDRSTELVSEDTRRWKSKHVVVAQFASRAAAQKYEPLVVRGSATCTNPEIVGDIGRAGLLQVRLEGVERFYINQAEAERIERVLRTQPPGDAGVLAIVSIGRDGRARLKGLVVEGERIELRWL